MWSEHGWLFVPHCLIHAWQRRTEWSSGLLRPLNHILPRTNKALYKVLLRLLKKVLIRCVVLRQSKSEGTLKSIFY